MRVQVSEVLDHQDAQEAGDLVLVGFRGTAPFPPGEAREESEGKE